MGSAATQSRRVRFPSASATSPRNVTLDTRRAIKRRAKPADLPPAVACPRCDRIQRERDAIRPFDLAASFDRRLRRPARVRAGALGHDRQGWPAAGRPAGRRRRRQSTRPAAVGSRARLPAQPSARLSASRRHGRPGLRQRARRLHGGRIAQLLLLGRLLSAPRRRPLGAGIVSRRAMGALPCRPRSGRRAKASGKSNGHGNGHGHGAAKQSDD